MIVFTHEHLREVVAHYLTQPAFAFDVETVGTHRGDPRRNRVLWLALATKGRADVIPLGHPNGEFVKHVFPLTMAGEKRLLAGKDPRPSQYSRDVRKATTIWTEAPEQIRLDQETREILRPLLFHPEIVKIAQNSQFDICSLAKHFGGDLMPGPHFDTMVASFLLDTRVTGSNGLADITKREIEFVMTKGVGKMVEAHSFREVAEYAYIDAKATWLDYLELREKIDAVGMNNLMNLEMDVLEVLCSMAQAGAPIDVQALTRLDSDLAYQLQEAEAAVYRAAGRAFPLGSNPEKIKVLFGSKEDGGQGLRPRRETATGNASVDQKALEFYAGKNDVVDALIHHSDLAKLRSTYTLPYLGGMTTRTTAGKTKDVVVESMLVEDRIHTTFVQTGAETGRFSCVAGTTLLPTNRGIFTFAEYEPQEGDLVMTHVGRWMPILRKIYKGVDPMFRIVLENGSTLDCTMDHRLLTSSGWVRVADLTIGSEVASYVGIEEVRQRLGEPQVRGRCLCCGGQAYYSTSSPTPSHDVSERALHPSRGTEPERSEGGAGSALLPLQGGGAEPYAGQEWFPTPQLCGACGEHRRLRPGQGGQAVSSGAPDGAGAGVGAGGSPSRLCCASHRRGQDEQLGGQLGSGDSIRAWTSARASSRISEVTALGPMGVWDVEVQGDHSYLCQGFVNHNSRSPNLQNVPNASTENGKAIRNLFVAGKGYKLVVADYSQIEPRFLADLAEDPTMLNAYLTGQDIYTALANPLGLERKAGKVLVLAMSYGIGDAQMADSLKVTQKKVKEIRRDFAGYFPRLAEYKKEVITECKRRRPCYASTMLGRRRYLPDLFSRDEYSRARAERQAFNMRIQGSAADAIKVAMVRLHHALQEADQGAQLLLTVHDELVVRTPESHAEDTLKYVVDAMEGIDMLKKVPLVAEAKIADTWAQGK